MNKQSTKERIHVNMWGEFDKGCVCHGNDFFTVVRDGDGWKEIEPVAQWDGWVCPTCERVISDDGVVLDNRHNVTMRF